jgi:hypothetical protein
MRPDNGANSGNGPLVCSCGLHVHLHRNYIYSLLAVFPMSLHRAFNARSRHCAAKEQQRLESEFLYNKGFYSPALKKRVASSCVWTPGKVSPTSAACAAALAEVEQRAPHRVGGGPSEYVPHCCTVRRQCHVCVPPPSTIGGLVMPCCSCTYGTWVDSTRAISTLETKLECHQPFVCCC